MNTLHQVLSNQKRLGLNVSLQVSRVDNIPLTYIVPLTRRHNLIRCSASSFGVNMAKHEQV